MNLMMTPIYRNNPECESGTRYHHAGRMSQRGFTLAEAIIVIVITGIIGAVVAVFIRIPVQSYVDTAARAELTDRADTALRRMARDLRLALPNSIRVSTGTDGNPYIEMLLTKTGGRYFAEEDGLGLTGVLSFDATNPSPSPNSFQIVGAMPAGAQAIAVNDYIVVYNLNSDTTLPTTANAYRGDNRAWVGAVNNATKTVTMKLDPLTGQTNPFASQPTPAKMKSPTARFQVVTEPVTYVCNRSSPNNNLIRYWGYPIQLAQPTDMTVAPLLAANNAKLATEITPWTPPSTPSCIFQYGNTANIHAGLISLTLTMRASAINTETVILSNQVHVDNTP